LYEEAETVLENRDERESPIHSLLITSKLLGMPEADDAGGIRIGPLDADVSEAKALYSRH
jgi:hypothetical protein